MKFNLINLLYLFIRLAPIIVISFFSLQFVFNQDLVAIIYLIGLIITCLVNLSVGNIFFPWLSRNRPKTNIKRENLVCNTLSLNIKEGPLSNMPLSQTVLGFSLFFFVYILFKNNSPDQKMNKDGTPYRDPAYPNSNVYESTNRIYSNNIPLLVILPILIFGDLLWNISNGCADYFFLMISLILGSSMGLLWAFITDNNSRRREVGCGGNYHECSTGDITSSNAVYLYPASGKELDLSLFNVINNSVCNQTNYRSIYKCRPIHRNRSPATNAAQDTTSSKFDQDITKLNKILNPPK